MEEKPFNALLHHTILIAFNGFELQPYTLKSWAFCMHNKLNFKLIIEIYKLLT